MSGHLAYVGIGANLGDARTTVERAIQMLCELGEVRRRSRLYRTTPWGVLDQPDFVNAVVALDTTLAPLELLRGLQAVERRLGRRPAVRWGPRAIDLDLLTYDDARLSGELLLPHPRMLERAFVLVPLAEIDPAYAAARDALDSDERSGVVALDDPSLRRGSRPGRAKA